jgi:hypothetical protein
MSAPTAYPLAWPFGRPRTKRPASSQFRTHFGDWIVKLPDGILKSLREPRFHDTYDLLEGIQK